MQTVLIFLAALSIAILVHEAGHAAFALALTREQVTLQVGLGPSAAIGLGRLELRLAPILYGGFCTHQGAERSGDRALIAAAGPVASIFLAACAVSLHERLSEEVLIASVFMALFTLVPMRYPGGADSDGLAILRALFPTARVVLRPAGTETRPQRPLRLPFAILLGICTVLAFLASVGLGLVAVALFGAVWLAERHAA